MGGIVVLIVPDYFDPEGYYVDLADQYAGAGYLAACPDMFSRQGKLSEQTHEAASARIDPLATTKASPTSRSPLTTSAAMASYGAAL
jgi:dienelactone hydrolase